MRRKDGKHHSTYKGSVIVTCVTCGKQVERRPDFVKRAKQSFCSVECYNQTKKGKSCISNQHARPFYNGDRNPNFKGGRDVPCVICGKTVWRSPKEFKGHRFCSRKCQGKWLSQNPTFTPEKFLRMVNGTWHKRPTRPEASLGTIIKLLGLPYKYCGDGQFILGGKCPDFVNTNSHKKVIEMFGDYWHRGQNPDDRASIFAAFGYDTLVIWQRELKNPESVKQKLLEFDSEVIR